MLPEDPPNIPNTIEHSELLPLLREQSPQAQAVCSDQPNPLHAVRRRQRGLWFVAALMLGACAWWAYLPIDVESTPISVETLIAPAPAPAPPATPNPPDAQDAESLGAIDPNLFAINLWNPVPAPPPPLPSQDTARAEAVTPPSPLNIQLIGIITDQENGQSIQKAALYDADSDRLLIIADGDELRNHLVRVLAGGVVELTDGRSTKRLILRPDSQGGAR